MANKNKRQRKSTSARPTAKPLVANSAIKTDAPKPPALPAVVKPEAKPEVKTEAKPNGEAKQTDKKVEKVPAIEHLLVPASLLLAAETVRAPSDAARAYLTGVYIHATDDRCRVAATDGKRMFVASFAKPGTAPAWLKDGVIVSGEGLKARVSVLVKLHGPGSVKIGYASGLAKATISDENGNDIFQVPVLKGATFPEYERVLPVQTFIDLDQERRSRQQWEPIGIRSGYLKHVGDIAKVLESGLNFEAMDKASKAALKAVGMVIRSYQADDRSSPLLFDFSLVPGALLVVMPEQVLPSFKIATETVKLLERPLADEAKGIPAYRAHATRWRQKADAESDPALKAEFLRRSEELLAKVASVLRILPGLPALEAPKEPKAPELSLGAEKPAEQPKPVEQPKPAEKPVEAAPAAAVEPKPVEQPKPEVAAVSPGQPATLKGAVATSQPKPEPKPEAKPEPKPEAKPAAEKLVETAEPIVAKPADPPKAAPKPEPTTRREARMEAKGKRQKQRVTATGRSAGNGMPGPAMSARSR